MKPRFYSCSLPIESFREKLRSIVQVERDRPMLKFLGFPFFGGRGIDGPKEMFGILDERSFKIWDNDTYWSSLTLTYVQGVYAHSDSGTTVVMRPRRNWFSRLLHGVVLGLLAGYPALQFLMSPPPTALGICVAVIACLVLGLLASIPFVAPHRFIGKALREFLERELQLVDSTAALPPLEPKITGHPIERGQGGGGGY